MPLLILLLPLAALALYVYSSAADASIFASSSAADDSAPGAGDSASVPGYAAGLLDSIGAAVNKIFTVPPAGAPYVDAIAKAERDHGIPQSLLARLLYQESRYRDDIITGKVKSPTGALGIAQFMPATAADLGVDPLDAPAAIDAAAEYLRALFDKLGSWPKALAAYNWGIGNVQRKGIAQAPTETRNYVNQILADVTV